MKTLTLKELLEIPVYKLKTGAAEIASSEFLESTGIPDDMKEGLVKHYEYYLNELCLIPLITSALKLDSSRDTKGTPTVEYLSEVFNSIFDYFYPVTDVKKHFAVDSLRCVMSSMVSSDKSRIFYTIDNFEGQYYVTLRKPSYQSTLTSVFELITTVSGYKLDPVVKRVITLLTLNFWKNPINILESIKALSN